MTGATVTLRRVGAALAVGIDRPAPLPLAALVTGQPAEAVADLLPRLFNLCRAAQGAAARASLALPTAPGDAPAALAAEVLRDHLIRFCVTLPPFLGLPVRPLPRDPSALWLHLPAGVAGLPGWMSSQALAAPVMRGLLAAFRRGEAATTTLPPPPAMPDPDARAVACENSPAGRQAHHPLLAEIAARHGRGPLWRAMGMVVDAAEAHAGRLPAIRVAGTTAFAPAARGTYALRLTQDAGRVTGIARLTPTDHMLAPGGALEQALASLPAAKGALARLVVALHDPCVPVTVREAADA